MNRSPFEIDTHAQLLACQLYYQMKKELAAKGVDESSPELKSLAQTMIINRLVLELFPDELKVDDQKVQESILCLPIDTNAKEFCDVELGFKSKDDENFVSFQLIEMYCMGSLPILLITLGQGGSSVRKKELNFIRSTCHSKSTAQAVMDLITANAG